MGKYLIEKSKNSKKGNHFKNFKQKGKKEVIGEGIDQEERDQSELLDSLIEKLIKGEYNLLTK